LENRDQNNFSLMQRSIRPRKRILTRKERTKKTET
jgi:hypothetical protein